MTLGDGAATSTLLDEFFPTFDVYERHSVTIAASPARAFAALRTADLSGHAFTRVLFALRALPAWLLSLGRGRPSIPPRKSLVLESFERRGFFVLAERPDRELLIGLQGRFWTLDGNLERLDARAAREPIPAGRARAGWNFSLEATSSGGTVLTTETRVLCADAATRARFRWYWRLIRPGSGLIRRGMLASIRRVAESPDS